MASTYQLNFFYRRQGRATVQMLNLIAITQCLHVRVGFSTTGNRHSIIKKIEGMKEFILTGMFIYTLT